MTYREALAWLYGLQRFGIKLGLENIRRLCSELDVPGSEQRVIHVAGTNGKGSVCAMIDSILRANGYRSGLFTSPHLVTFRERIQVNGELISESAVADGLTRICELVRDWDPHPTFFEVTTALALHHFKRAECEFIVLETGMGGRLDATNAVRPIVSVITPIDYDHQKWLGDTLIEIATEKAGIIKPGVPVVSAPQRPEAEGVIRETAPETAFTSQPYAGRLGLSGEHQKRNAALAVASLRAAKIPLRDSAIYTGLTSVEWPARFQKWDERTIIDGAHNPAGARILVETWRQELGTEAAALVFGVLQDKQVPEIFRTLNEITQSVHLPRFHGARVAAPIDLATTVNDLAPGKSVSIHESCGEAIETARRTGARVLIAGSLHLAGEALAHLQGRPAAFEECDQ